MTELRPHLILPDGNTLYLSGSLVIGRDAKCDIPLAGANVSRDHAHIYEAAGHYQVVDSQSRNGTYVNGVRVVGHTVLRNGDQVRVGDHVIRFVNPEGSLDVSMSEALKDGVTMVIMDKVPSWMVLLDIRSSTELALSMGAEAYAAMLGSWFDRCRLAIEAEGGSVNKSTGDGLLAYWQDPNESLSQEVSMGITALLQLQQEENPAFRIVVHHGRVVYGSGAGLGEEQLAGPDVHFIFRCEKIFGDLECYLGATESAAQRLAPWFKSELIGTSGLKGFDGEYGFYRLSEVLEEPSS